MFRQFSRVCWSFSKTSNINFNFVRNAGHSKWQNIRHIKAEKDAAKAELFNRLRRQIRLAVIEGGSCDVKKNIKLENIVDQAKRANMPSSTVQNILKSCENNGANVKSFTLEIRGPGSCLILCEVLTSNLHQLKQSISTLLRKHQSKYIDGGLSQFTEKGIIYTEVEKSKSIEEVVDAATDHAILAGAEDVSLVEQESEDESPTLEFLCGATNLRKVVEELEKFSYKIISASTEYIPLRYRELQESDMKLCSNLFEKLEALPEVVKLTDNIA